MERREKQKTSEINTEESGWENLPGIKKKIKHLISTCNITAKVYLEHNLP